MKKGLGCIAYVACTFIEPILQKLAVNCAHRESTNSKSNCYKANQT